MSTKMLINATRGGQLRVAIVEGTILQEFQVEVTEDDQTRGNIYRGVVANIQPSLNAAFVDLGEERHGFLPAGDVLSWAYHSKPPKDVRRPNISQVLEKGKPILVQVTKDGVGQKGPALSTNLALAGRYLVLTPYDGVRGISRKAQDDAARKKIRERLKKLELPDEHGVIVRTNGLDQNQQTLNRDLNALLRLWKKVKTEAGRGRGAKLVYSDQDLVMQALRDYLDASISEVVVDSDEVFAKAEAFMKAFMPRSKTQLVRYEDRLPLFSRYRLETQIDRIYERTASLPSGGGIVIDQTEALTAIDVNSGRATKTTNHDESIFKINCEAAKEVARQLRLRDIGGLVVVDFIDMRLRKHQNRLERVMRDAMKRDNARHSVGRISPNGLLEINRQRIKQSLRLRTHRSCPTCAGAGTTPTPEFAALRLLSRIEARAASGLVQSVTLALHPEIADTLQNRYRTHLAAIEIDHGVAVEILAAPGLSLNEERVEWVQREDGASSSARVKARRAVNAADLTPPERRGGAKREDDEEDEEKSASKSGRRRRRRRRRSRGGGDSSEAADQQKQGEQKRSSKPKDEQKDAKAEEKVAEEKTAKRAAAAEEDQEEEAKGRVRRRRRRRRRRRSSGDRDEQQAAEQQAGEKQAAEQQAAEKDEKKAGEKAAKRAGEKAGKKSEKKRASDDDASVEEKAAESGAAEAAEDEAASEKKVEKKRVSRSRSRRRKKSEEADRAPEEAAADERRGRSPAEEPESKVAADAEGDEDVAKDAAAKDAAAKDAAAKDAAAKDTAPEDADATSEDGESGRKVHRRRRRRPRGRRAEQKADGGEQAAADDGEPSEAEDFDQGQPESHASALHKVRPRDPFVEALSSETESVERPVSQRLRWQWWGGVQDAGGSAPEGGRAASSDGDSSNGGARAEGAAGDEQAAAEAATAEAATAEAEAATATEPEADIVPVDVAGAGSPDSKDGDPAAAVVGENGDQSEEPAFAETVKLDPSGEAALGARTEEPPPETA